MQIQKMIFKRDSWQEIYFVLSANKLRTFVTAFGVIWGLFMLIVMLGAGSGLRNGVTGEFGDFATNSVFIWPQPTSMPYHGFKRGRQYNFTDGDTHALLSEIKEIEHLSPRIMGFRSGGASRVERGKTSSAFGLVGDYPSINNLDPLDFPQGRFINDNDVKEKRNVCVLGKNAYEELYLPGEEAVGTYVKVEGVYCMVIGVHESRHSGGWGDWQNSWVVLPITTLRKIKNLRDFVGFYGITTQAGTSAAVVEQKARKILAERHDIHPDDAQAFGVNNIEERFKQMTGLFTGINVLVLIIGMGSLLAGVIGISNIMLITIRERFKEIGIKRAIGASPSMIAGQILFESVVLTFIAGYIGLLLGIGVVEAVNKAIAMQPKPPDMFNNPEVHAGVVLASFAIILFAGLLAGILPASRALKIKPIEAIRG